MKVKRKEIMLLGVLVVVLSGLLYYYLFFKNYTSERVSLRESNAQAQAQIELEHIKLISIERVRAELEEIEEFKDLLVTDLVETGDIADKIAVVCKDNASSLVIKIAEPAALTEKSMFYTVTADVSFMTARSQLANLLKNLESIDMCNRVFVCDISIPEGSLEDCSVNVTMEFLYIANKFPPLRKDKQE